MNQAQAARQATAAASNAAAARAQSGMSYCPYRSGGSGGGKPPFADAKGSGMTITASPWGAWVSFNTNNF